MAQSYALSSSTKVIAFEDNKDESNTFENIKGFYGDLDMLGMHYLLSSSLQSKGKVVKRHYTITNCME